MKNKKLISILIVLLFTSLCGGNTLTFYEENLIPQQIITYSDNSIVFRLTERLNNTCNVPTLTYRVLYPNGTNNLVTVYDHQIPTFNFCRSDNPVPQNPILPGQIIFDQIYLPGSIPNYIFVTYIKITEEKVILQFGMLIDWNGKIIR